MCSENDHRQRRMLGIDLLEQLQSVNARHAQIGDHDGRPVHGDLRQRHLAAFGVFHAIASRRQAQTDQLQQIGIIVNQQDFSSHRR